jgi:hypothetical protein
MQYFCGSSRFAICFPLLYPHYPQLPQIARKALILLGLRIFEVYFFRGVCYNFVAKEGRLFS